MKNESFDPFSLLSRDPELFKNIEGEEVEAPRKFHWDALDNQLFMIHRVRGDLSGYILILSSDSEDIYDKIEGISESSTTIIQRFIENFSNELDLNILVDPAQICPATQNFSSEKEFGNKIMDFQSKKQILRVLQKYSQAQGGFQFEKMFKFKVKDIVFKFYFCLSANEIKRVNQ